MPFSQNVDQLANNQAQPPAQDFNAAPSVPAPASPSGADFEARLSQALERSLGQTSALQPEPPHQASGQPGSGAPLAPQPFPNAQAPGQPPAPQGQGNGWASPAGGPQGPTQGGALTSDPILEQLRQIDPNLAGKYSNGQDALRGFASAQALIGQRNELADLGGYLQASPYQVYQNLRQVYEQGQAQSAQPAQVTQPPQAAQPTQADTQQGDDAFDPLWLSHAARDPQTGRWVDVPGGRAGTGEKIEGWYQRFYDRQRQRLENPIENPRVKDFIDKNYVNKSEHENLAKQIQQTRNEIAAQNTVSRLAHKIFIDPSNPRAGRTLYGNVFVQKILEAQDLNMGLDPKTGKTDYSVQDRYAENQAEILSGYYSMMSALQAQQNANNPPGQPQYPQQLSAPQQPYVDPRFQQVPQSQTWAQPRQQALHPGLAGGTTAPAAAGGQDGLPPPGSQDRLDAMLARNLNAGLEQGAISQRDLYMFAR